MSLGEIVSPLSSLLRLILTLGQKKNRPERQLEARLIARGIVAELPEDIPFYITAEDGTREKGIYIIGLLIWNRGTLPVVENDFLPTSPLTVKISDKAKFVGSRILAVEDEVSCSCQQLNDQQLKIHFDCLNPEEYLVIPLFVTGDPYVNVELSGRIIGQSHPIDHTAAEVKASVSERLASLMVLIFVLNMLPGFIIGGALIIKEYGLRVFMNDFDSISHWYSIPFSFGAIAIFMFLSSRIVYWFERRTYPEGYPLQSDFEPPLHKSIIGLCQAVFQGKKIRLSTSIFSWGQPIIMSEKRVRRRSINDWVK
ncbi:hypothetical protein RE680_02175 [Serratia marcescens]|jgi:hypothetical protein|uniref:Uncharacterized protein n=1 Tax=Serratia surfactantfaciens TaxID=2741499 RepID=A0ABS0LY60_9GAMM|nr:hypothetical protein [Serratia surfactantfaciens]MBH1920248.1 hypothetical protein [Serratia surfactantfaciens]WMW61892.1 hypothetical protein RE680_02175 [Serratia marcescens]